MVHICAQFINTAYVCNVVKPEGYKKYKTFIIGMFFTYIYKYV